MRHHSKLLTYYLLIKPTVCHSTNWKLKSTTVWLPMITILVAPKQDMIVSNKHKNLSSTIDKMVLRKAEGIFRREWKRHINIDRAHRATVVTEPTIHYCFIPHSDTIEHPCPASSLCQRTCQTQRQPHDVDGTQRQCSALSADCRRLVKQRIKPERKNADDRKNKRKRYVYLAIWLDRDGGEPRSSQETPRCHTRAILGPMLLEIL